MLQGQQAVNNQTSPIDEAPTPSYLKRAVAPFIALDAAWAINIENAFAVEQTSDGYRVSLAVVDPFSLPEANRIFNGVVESRHDWEARRQAAYAGDNGEKRPMGFIEGKPTRALIISVHLVGPELICEGCRLAIDDEVTVTRRQFSDLRCSLPSQQGFSEIDVALHATSRLAFNLFRARRERGDVVFADVSRGLLLQPDGSWELFPPQDLLGRIANQEITSKVAEGLAKLAVTHDVPLLYRGCAIADRDVSEAISDRLKQPLRLERSDIDELLINARGHRVRLLRRAVCSVEPIPHEGLGLQAYLRASAPLRVFQDFVNFSQLIAWAAGEAPPYSREQLSEFAGQVNARSPERVRRKGERKYLPLIESDLELIKQGAVLTPGMLRSLVADCRDAGVVPLEVIRHLIDSISSRPTVAAPLLADLYFSAEMTTSQAVRESARWMVRQRPDLVDLMVNTAIESGSLRRHSSNSTVVEAGRLFESLWVVEGRVITTQKCFHPRQHLSEAIEFSKLQRLQFSKLCGLQARGETLSVPYSALFPEIRALQWELKGRDLCCNLMAEVRGLDGSWEASLEVRPSAGHEDQVSFQVSGGGESWLYAVEDAAHRGMYRVRAEDQKRSGESQ